MRILSVYPRLVLSDASAAIDFYVAGLGATELERYTDDTTGKIQHAMLDVGGVRFAVKDEGDGDPSPSSLNGNPLIMAVEADDADALWERMLAAGATVVYQLQDWEYGQRGGRLADPFGHFWMIASKLT